ncbi:MAG: hypothetical protein GY803_12015 [Chloroflexi bacterium]|nr:hypothetical protein [Chloroflexota bacterium]
MLSIIVHIANEDAIVCEVDNIPNPTDLFVHMQNPRRRDGKDVHYLDEEVTSMLVPWHRITFVQLLPSADTEEVIGFVRE